MSKLLVSMMLGLLVSSGASLLLLSLVSPADAAAVVQKSQPRGVKPCFLKLSQAYYIDANRLITTKTIKSSVGEDYLAVYFVMDGTDEKVSITIHKDDAERFVDDFYSTYNRICK